MKTVPFATRLPEAAVKDIHDRAKASGVTPAELVRRWVLDRLERPAATEEAVRAACAVVIAALSPELGLAEAARLLAENAGPPAGGPP